LDITANGIRHYVEIEGEGVPCFVICIAGTALYQETLSPRLREELKLIFYEVRGSGRSDGDAEQVTLEQLAGDLEALRQSLGLGKVAVMGASAPGLLALDYAHKYPDSVSRAILIGTPPHMKIAAEQERYWAAVATPARKAIHEQNVARLTEEKLKSLSPGVAWWARYASRGAMYFYDPAFDCSPYWVNSVVKREFVDRYFGELLTDFDRTEHFPEIQCPVFLAMGEHDYVVPPTLWAAYKDRFPRATWALFKQSGHWPMLEEPELFDRRLLHWLKGEG